MAKHTAVAQRLSINQKYIFAAGLAALAVGAIAVAARPDPTGSSPAPRAEVQTVGMLSPGETNFDFGSISMAAGNVTHRYWVRNTGSAPIVIRTVYTSCMCTTATLVKGGRKSAAYGMPGHGYMPPLNETLQPNDAALIEVVFDPAAHGPAGIGKIARTVTIQTDLDRPLELGFVASVRP